MPYRSRAVKRIRGQPRLKKSSVTAKFVLQKTYQLSNNFISDTSNTYLLRVNASTPFDPISDINGLWSEAVGLQEPVGLDSNLYSHYRHCYVNSCHMSASVTDNYDKIHGENEKLVNGQVSIVRGSDTNSITSTLSAPNIKKLYGQKSRDFTLTPRSNAVSGQVDALNKSAYVSNGYSAKKTWNTAPAANDALRIVNLSGSSNVPDDSTFLFLCVAPRYETTPNTNAFLLPTLVTIRLSYIVTFVEPTIIQTVPLPLGTGIGAGNRRKQQSSRRFVKRAYESMPSMKNITDFMNVMNQINRMYQPAQPALGY